MTLESHNKQYNLGIFTLKWESRPNTNMIFEVYFNWVSLITLEYCSLLKTGSLYNAIPAF